MTMSDISIKDPRVQKVIGGVILLVIIIAVWFTQIFSPNKEAIDGKRQKLEQLNLTLQSAKLQAGKLAEIEAELDEAFVKYKLLEELLPVDRNVPDFLNKLNFSAREKNVKILRVDLDPSEVREFFTADPYRLELLGNYHDMGAFLCDVANLPFIATAKNIQMKKSKVTDVSTMLTITSYHLAVSERLERPTEALGDADIVPEESKPGPGLGPGLKPPVPPVGR